MDAKRAAEVLLQAASTQAGRDGEGEGMKPIELKDLKTSAEAGLLGRIAQLEAELAEARKDGERLDALEALIGDNKGGGLLLHHQIGGHVKWSGVGVGLAHRTLRKAIDDLRGAK